MIAAPMYPNFIGTKNIVKPAGVSSTEQIIDATQMNLWATSITATVQNIATAVNSIQGLEPFLQFVQQHHPELWAEFVIYQKAIKELNK